MFYSFSNRDHVYKTIKKAKSDEEAKSKMAEADTPLFQAVMDDDAKRVEEILRNITSRDEINWQDKYGFTVLHSASAKSDINPLIPLV